MYSADWAYPTKIKFGEGRVSEIGKCCIELGMKNPLLVTDRALSRLDITQSARTSLKDAGFEGAVFDGVDQDPDDQTLDAGLQAYRDGAHHGVVAFGGGSALDLGKTIAMMAGQTRPVWDFEDIGDWWTRADADSIAPIIAVPTTAGTGSEVSRATVITHSQSNTKKILFHPKLMPGVAILDPGLTVSLPPILTAGTGMDALAHNIEAYCGTHPHPLSDGIALEGTRLVKDHILRAFRDGSGIEARGNMLIASAMGAIAFQRGLGAVHALSHPIGALYHSHHGTTNAVLMPHVFEWNRPAIETKINRLARHLEIEGGFDGFIGWLRKLNTELGIPQTVTALGVTPDKFSEIAAMSLKDPTAAVNPRPFTKDGALEILKAAA